MSKKSNGYWKNKENCKTEIENYLLKYKSLNETSNKKERNHLIRSVHKYHNHINVLLKEFGYEEEFYYKDKHYYTSLNNLAKELSLLVLELGRFPNLKEMTKYLRRDAILLHSQKNIMKIKEILNYTKKENLMDSRGWNNRSIGEYQIAEFLIAYNIPYKRDVQICEESKHTCDFVLYPIGIEPIWIEYWGGSNGTLFDYLKIMEVKKEIYIQENKQLVSIYYEDIDVSYDLINKILYEKLLPFLNLKYLETKNEIFIPPYKMSSEQLLNEIIHLKIDNKTLPTIKNLYKNNKNKIVYEILKRYKRYSSFAKEYGYLTARMNYETDWNELKIIETIFSIINDYGYIQTRDVLLQNEKYKKFISYVYKKLNGLNNAKFLFYNYCIQNNILIPKTEINRMLYCIKSLKKYYPQKEHQIEIFNILNKIKMISKNLR